MDFKKVSGFLGQQLKALGEMKELIAHEKKNPRHKVSAEDVKAFEDYVATMEKASRAGKALADFYAAGSVKAEPKKEEEPAALSDVAANPEAEKSASAEPATEVDPKEEKARLKKLKEGAKIINDIHKLVESAQETNAAVAAEKAGEEKTKVADEDDDLDFLD